MALNLMSAFEQLRQKLGEMKAQGLYYAGELVFASPAHPWEKIDLNTFYLQTVPHGDKLDRIVMLFTNQSVTKTAMIVIEKSHVSCAGVQKGRFPVDAFENMQRCSAGVKVGSEDFDEIPRSVRLIYDKPLFLTLLYQNNLLRKDIHLHSIVYGDPSANLKKDLAFYKEVRQRLSGFFGEDIFRLDFPPMIEPLESTELVYVLTQYLDGLRCMQQLLLDTGCEAAESSSPAFRKRRCAEIEDLILLLRAELSKLEDVFMLAVPYPAPETAIALWHCNECFPRDMHFGEMIGIRIELEQMLGKQRSDCSDHEDFPRDKLRKYQMEILLKQLREVDSMLEKKTGDMRFDWNKYLGDLWEVSFP